MTAIWDELASKNNRLTEGYDEVIATRFHDCLTSIYEAIRFRKEYQNVTYFSVDKENRTPNLLENLGRILKLHPELWNGSMFQDMHWIIEALHDFDHANDGHHTENILVGNIGTAIEKRENKKLWKKMEGFHNKDFWKYICKKCHGYETDEKELLVGTILLNCSNCQNTIEVLKNE